jgi:hypothetical protein
MPDPDEIWQAYHVPCPICPVSPKTVTELDERLPADPSVGIPIALTIAVCPSCHTEFAFGDSGEIWSMDRHAFSLLGLVGRWKGVWGNEDYYLCKTERDDSTTS